MFALVCSGRKKMVNFRGTCDLPLFLSQTTASLNKAGERKIYRGRGGFFFFFLWGQQCCVDVCRPPPKCHHMVLIWKPEELIDDFDSEASLSSPLCWVLRV